MRASRTAASTAANGDLELDLNQILSDEPEPLEREVSIEMDDGSVSLRSTAFDAVIDAEGNLTNVRPRLAGLGSSISLDSIIDEDSTTIGGATRSSAFLENRRVKEHRQEVQLQEQLQQEAAAQQAVAKPGGATSTTTPTVSPARPNPKQGGKWVKSWKCMDPAIPGILGKASAQELQEQWINGGKPFLRLDGSEEVLTKRMNFKSLTYTVPILAQIGCVFGWSLVSFLIFGFRYKFHGSCRALCFCPGRKRESR
ncbi:unnamed protein product [Amoebophrya sp. A25]|nr:unnamed protein product [Amoebophrya sp. A25]|eukprot:GSA25T00007335001.1